MENWDANGRMAVRIQSSSGFDRIILINKLVLIVRPAAWDENFDIWIMPTGLAAETYPEIQELLDSPPTHIINFTRNEEVAKSAKPQGVNRWKQVAKLLTMPVPWEGYRVPFGEHPYQQVQRVGYFYKGVFNKENKMWCNGQRMDSRVFVEDCVLTVWHRYRELQKIDHFVRCAAGEGWGYT